MLAILLVMAGCCAAPAPSQVIQDTPFWQEVAVRYKPEVDLSQFELRSIRAGRDGHVLINTNKGLLQAFEGRLLPYDGYRGLVNLDHLDLELLEGKFVFLTDKFFLPLHGAGRDYLANGDKGFRRLAALSPGRYLLLSPSHIVSIEGGQQKSLPNPGFAELVASKDGVFLWSAEKLARWDDGSLTPFAAPKATITGVFPIDRDNARVATSGSAFDVTAKNVAPIKQVLPVESLTSIHRDAEGRWWFGSTDGAFRIDPDGKLSYYTDNRWLPHNHVIDITSDGRGDVYILTKGGVVALDFEKMTLEAKAGKFLKTLRRHHVRFGMVADTATPGADYGRSMMHDSDNDGLWSSIYIAAEAFRYSVTQTADARDNLMDGFDAIERLVTITPIPGFQARSFELDGFHVADKEAWRRRQERDFEWKGTTSSDELVGTMFLYTVLAETIGKTDEQARERIAKLVGSIVGHIIDHDLYYVDVDGKPTRWGFWNPKNINTPAALHDRRLNSIEILGFLGLAYSLTGDEKFKRTFDDLVDRHGYAENTIRYLPDPMGPWNHSDDELYWLSYYVLLKHPLRPELLPTFQKSAQEHFEANKRKRNPLWNIMFGAITGQPIDIDGVAFWLREFPIDRRTWHSRNSHRKDIKIDRRRFVPPESDPVLPPDERRVHKWNSNEMDLDGGSEGGSAESGAEFLLPYWMGRHYGFISPPVSP